MEYNTDIILNSNKIILDGKGNLDEIITIIKEFTGLTIYPTDRNGILEILNNPEEHFTDKESIDKLLELKNFLEFMEV